MGIMCIKYVDDVTFLHFIRTEQEDFLQRERLHLEAWSHSVGLILNQSKSFVMNYVTKKTDPSTYQYGSWCCYFYCFFL